MEHNFTITFWGVRGTIPIPQSHSLQYGGNTSCIEIRCNGRQIILDAGTGIYSLGKQTDIFHTDVFLSHTHLDHIQGLPFFAPLYREGSNVALWAGNLLPDYTVEGIVSEIMQSPVFPLTINDVQSRVEFNDFHAGQNICNKGLRDAGIIIATLPLNHPDRATGYRISCGDTSLCYITDVEHTIGELDETLIEFIRDTDVFIYDSTYDDDHFTPFIGWGHSTWQQGARLADAANVHTFIAFHHDPAATDDTLNHRAKKLSALRPGSIIAHEGLTLDLTTLGS